MRDTIEMAREVGFTVGLGSPALEKFERLIAMARADERKIVMNEPLTKEMWQRFEDEIRADEREALQAEVLEQCRINGMSAEREDALRAELKRLKASIALDKMAENARELGLDYEPARQDVPETNFGNMAHPDYAWPTIEDYEKEVGFKVNDAFKAAWTMARTTNDLFKQMGETK